MRGSSGATVVVRTGELIARRSLLRRSFLLLLLCASALCLAGIFQHGLWTPDEPREAEIGREMLASSWSAMPTLGGEPFLEKPPLYPWITAVFYSVLGVSAGVARLPAALFSLGAILVAYAMGRRAGGRTAGLFSGLVMSTLAGFAQVSHSAVNDTALIFFVALGQLAVLEARDRQRRGEPSQALLLSGICAGLAFLTKGFIGPVLLFGPPLLAVAIGREWSSLRFLLPRASAWCAAFVVLFGVPWVLALARTGGWSAVQECLVNNTVGRSVSDARPDYGHARGIFYYLQAFPADVLPWTIAIPAVLMSGSTDRTWRAGRARYLGWSVLAGIALLSIPATKRGLYLMPLYPAGSALVGTWLSRVGSRRGSRIDRATVVGIGFIAGVLLLAFAAALSAVAWNTALPTSARSAAHAIANEAGTARLSITAAIALVLGMLVLAGTWRRRSKPSHAWTAVGGLCVAFFLWHAVLTPLLDPIKDLRRGSIEVARAVPDSEPMLGLALDETTRAIVPFYGGRDIRNVADSARAMRELEAGPARHLVVTDAGRAGIDAALLARLELVTTIEVNETRNLHVYRYSKTP